jgi:arsenate reductase-like glutaredoxin family protein
MATITIYGIKNCDTMKKAQRPGKSPPDHAL